MTSPVAVLKLNGPAQALADDIESRAHARGKSDNETKGASHVE